MRVSISLVLHSPIANKYFTSQHRPFQITKSRERDEDEMNMEMRGGALGGV